jgi:hypothetical protein
VSLEATLRKVLDGGRVVLGNSLLAEHESDHTSVGGYGYAGFFNENGLASRVDVSLVWDASALTLSSTAHLHLLTCTVNPYFCADGAGREGSAAFEETVEAVFDGNLGPARSFVSLMGSWLPAHRLAAEERRAILEAGLWTRNARGMFQVYATALVGHDIGYLHWTNPNERKVGLGVRFAPASP